MARHVGDRAVLAAMASLVSFGVAGAARADALMIEAEAARDGFDADITSPMLIKDDPLASGGSYITVAPGNNSNNTTPGSEGVARYRFSVLDTGTYRIWARVSIPTDADDSFWVRLSTPSSSGSWIKWNGIKLGSAWHWVTIKPEGQTTSSQFSLVAGQENELKIGYREDGTKLDAMIVTNDTSFNPNSPLTAPPALPVMQEPVQGETAIKVSWSTVPGATSYTLERRDATDFPPPETYEVIATGLTAHKFTDTAPYGWTQYRVTAVASTGSSVHPDPMVVPDPSIKSAGPSTVSLRHQNYELTLTAPMVMLAESPELSEGVGAPVGTDSKTAPPAFGRARLDFQIAAQTTAKMYVNVQAPNKSQDSFWARLDDGPWIKWNNIKDFCDDVHDSDNGDAPVLHTLTPGSHRYEFAYREGGTRLDGTVILVQHDGSPDPEGTNPCSD